MSYRIFVKLLGPDEDFKQYIDDWHIPNVYQTIGIPDVYVIGKKCGIKFSLITAIQMKIPVVTTQWMEDSIKENRWLPFFESKYFNVEVERRRKV